MASLLSTKQLPAHCTNRKGHNIVLARGRTNDVSRFIISLFLETKKHEIKFYVSTTNHIVLSSGLMGVLQHGNPSEDKFDAELVTKILPVWGKNDGFATERECIGNTNIELDNFHRDLLGGCNLLLKLDKPTYAGFREACVELYCRVEKQYNRLQVMKFSSAVEDGKNQARLGVEPVLKKAQAIKKKIQKEEAKPKSDTNKILRFKNELRCCIQSAETDGSMKMFLDAYNAEKKLMELEESAKKAAEEQKAAEESSHAFEIKKFGGEDLDSWEDLVFRDD